MTAAVGPDSTIRPAYITSSRSQKLPTTPRSWLISRTALPCSAVIRSSSVSTCAWTVTSSAVVGSSAISSRGSQLIAMASATRCRMPPDSTAG